MRRASLATLVEFQDRARRALLHAAKFRQPFQAFLAIGNQILRPDPGMHDDRRPGELTGHDFDGRAVGPVHGGLLTMGSIEVVKALYEMSARISSSNSAIAVIRRSCCRRCLTAPTASGRGSSDSA